MCHDGEINLDPLTSTFEGGLSTYRGRVEVCANRVYHSICDVGWDSRDVQVVCNQYFGTNYGKFSMMTTLSFAVSYCDSPTHVISKLVRYILVSHFLRDKGIYHRMSCAMEQSPLSASAVTALPPVQSAMWETIQLLWCVKKV